MDRAKVIFFRNLFLRMFVIGMIFVLLLFGATQAFWHVGTGWAMQFFLVDEKELGRIVLTFFVNMRLIILLLFLAPALALHWTAKKQ